MGRYDEALRLYERARGLAKDPKRAYGARIARTRGCQEFCVWGIT
jgi:hypothetical protein